MSGNGKVNILLVNEQPAKLLTYEAILSSLGENLIKASSGAEALQHFLKTELAVVLIGANRPEVDGFDLARLIHQQPQAQKPAIIFVSEGHLADPGWLKGYRQGTIDYISDPIIPELLQAKVSVFVELYRKTQQLETLNRELEQRVAAQTAELEASTAQWRLALLAKAGEVLIDSPDYKTMLSNLTQVIVPSLADWCVVDVIGEDDLIHRLAVVHHDPAKAALATRLQRDYPALNPRGEHTITRMIRQGQSWFDAKVSETRFVAEARDAEHLDILRGLGFASEMVVPLTARGRTLGTLTFVRGSPERPYEPADLSLAEELARRTALAVDNARLYSELRESEERFRVTIQNSPIVVYNTDRELHYTWVAKPHPGFPLEALGEPRAHETPGGDHVSPVISLKKRVLASGVGAREEISLPTASGGQTWDVTVEPLRAEDGKITGLTVVALDITERKRAEERMARLQAVAAALSAALTPSQVYEVIVQKAASALDARAGTLYILSEDGQWLELARMTGYGEGNSENKIRIPLSVPLPVAQAALTGEAVWLESAVSLPLWFEWRVLGSLNFSFAGARSLDGEEREFLLTLARLCAQALERARLYQEARQLNVELEKRVAERTAELERSLQELDKFTYAASHDLRTPLRGVRLLATWIVEDAKDVLPEASRKHLAKMQGRIQRLEKMLDDLLAYYRLDHHYYHNLEVVSTTNLVESVIDLLAPPPGFAITVQKNMPKLTTHRILLDLVFRNLISNAIKHHHRPDGRIEVSAREIDHFIEFSVTDDGPGIGPDFHERIFQIFYVQQPRDQVEGSGIGLALVRRAVESQGGTVKVISAEGQGAAFSFTWPKAEQGAGPADG